MNHQMEIIVQTLLPGRWLAAVQGVHKGESQYWKCLCIARRLKFWSVCGAVDGRPGGEAGGPASLADVHVHLIPTTGPD